MPLTLLKSNLSYDPVNITISGSNSLAKLSSN